MTTLTTTSMQTAPVRTASIPTAPVQTASMQTASIFSKPQQFWVQNREASLNWLALGLLLAAWNAADGGDEPSARPRPDSLRGYSSVSVRAVQQSEGRSHDVGRAGNL
jgi:hypothetical protein